MVVTETSKGRKGTSWGEVRRLVSLVDRQWVDERCSSGLSSGEGLIWAIRDPIVEERPMRDDPTETEDRVMDNGVEDKRLFVHEGEFSQPLQAISRDGNTLSAVIRESWDSTQLRALTKNSRASCREPHVSILGHITASELRRLLTTNEMGNGFANRFMWVCASRSKYFPFGGSVHPQALADRTSNSISFARKVKFVEWGQDARDQWEAVYPRLSEGKPGLLGSVTARSEAQAVRLTMIYALLDNSQQIRVKHLRAALAAWRYCEDSAKFIFGDTLGDPMADEVLQLLRANKDGVTCNEIMNYFGRNKPSAVIGRALSVVQSFGLASCSTSKTGGRSVERWFAVGDQNARGKRV